MWCEGSVRCGVVQCEVWCEGSVSCGVRVVRCGVRWDVSVV